MKDDPIIEAVRRVRHQISESVGHDPGKLLEYYRERQERCEGRLVGRESDSSKPREENTA